MKPSDEEEEKEDDTQKEREDLFNQLVDIVTNFLTGPKPIKTKTRLTNWLTLRVPCLQGWSIRLTLRHVI